MHCNKEVKKVLFYIHYQSLWKLQPPLIGCPVLMVIVELMLALYLRCIKKHRAQQVFIVTYNYYWLIDSCLFCDYIHNISGYRTWERSTWSPYLIHLKSGENRENFTTKSGEIWRFRFIVSIDNCIWLNLIKL